MFRILNIILWNQQQENEYSNSTISYVFVEISNFSKKPSSGFKEGEIAPLNLNSNLWFAE